MVAFPASPASKLLPRVLRPTHLLLLLARLTRTHCGRSILTASGCFAATASLSSCWNTRRYPSSWSDPTFATRFGSMTKRVKSWHLVTSCWASGSRPLKQILHSFGMNAPPTRRSLIESLRKHAPPTRRSLIRCSRKHAPSFGKHAPTRRGLIKH